MKILLIGNSGRESNDKGGQTLKLRIYWQKMIDEGADVVFVELERFLKNPFKVFSKIKKGIKQCDRIVLISGERACRLLIPFINRHNKKYKKVFVLPIVGSGILHYSIDYLNNEDKNRFITEKRFDLGKNREKISKMLKKVTLILPETDLMKEVYADFYHLDNCHVLNNFRDCLIQENKMPISKPLRFIYISRVMELKGIFDLMTVVNEINSDGIKVELDIYGDKVFDEKESIRFASLEKNSIKYCGSLENEQVVETIKKYDLFVFPTRAVYEGTPGVVSESLIAGVPILTSNFPQAKYLLKDGVDSIFFKMFNTADLKQKIIDIIDKKYDLFSMKKNASNSGARFTYDYEREKFLTLVCGR